MKCSICNSRIDTTFMNKIIGTIYRKGKNQKTVCKECQSKLSPSEIREKLF